MNTLLVLPSNQQQIIEQARFTYSPLRKAFEKQIKTIGDQGKKQVEDKCRQRKNNLRNKRVLRNIRNQRV